MLETLQSRRGVGVDCYLSCVSLKLTYVLVGFFLFFFFWYLPSWQRFTFRTTIANFLLLFLSGLCLIYCIFFEFCSEEGIMTFPCGLFRCALIPEYGLFSNESSSCLVR